jgi:hypothetical protein
MILERDCYAAAQIMIKRYGEDAAMQAAMRADLLGSADDFDGWRQWIRIMEAIKQLQRTRGPDESVN